MIARKKLNTENFRQLIVRVVGTSPLSFEARAGTLLDVKVIGPSPQSRPTIGARFKSKGYLLFNGQTKVGRLSPAALAKIGNSVPPTCKVEEVDKGRRVLRVLFSLGG